MRHVASRSAQRLPPRAIRKTPQKHASAKVRVSLWLTPYFRAQDKALYSLPSASRHSLSHSCCLVPKGSEGTHVPQKSWPPNRCKHITFRNRFHLVHASRRASFRRRIARRFPTLHKALEPLAGASRPLVPFLPPCAEGLRRNAYSSKKLRRTRGRNTSRTLLCLTRMKVHSLSRPALAAFRQIL